MNEADTLALAKRCADRMYADDLASQRLGIEVEVPAAGAVVATMTVRDDMVNGHDICHGGYIFTLADTAFAFACNAYDRVSVAASATIEFIAPARVGDLLRAEARELHRGGRSGIYDVTVSGPQGVVAVFRGRSAALNRAVLGAEA